METKKRYFIFASFFLFKLCLSIAQIPTANLLGYYPFSGNANDFSGNSKNGFVFDASLANDRFENTAKAYYFNGLNGYIFLPTSFDVVPRTINLWIYCLDTNYYDSYGAVFQSDNPNLLFGNSGIAVKTINGDNKLLLTISAITDTIDIEPETWINISMSVNSNKVIKYYVNSQFLGTKSFSGYYCSYDGDTNTFIGTNRNGTMCFFKGKIDDIRIYNKELSQNEIDAIYNEGICISHVSVTDTLIINMNVSSYFPVAYKNTIKVFPNPTNSIITIDCGQNYNNLNGNRIQITNSLGQALFNQAISQQLFTINLSQWTGNGLYLLYIYDSQNNIVDVRKIVLQ